MARAQAGAGACRDRIRTAAVSDDWNTWIVLVCPRGAEHEPAAGSHGERGYPPFFVRDGAGRLRSLVYVPMPVARQLAGEFGGKGNFSVAPEELQSCRPVTGPWRGLNAPPL
jgi:hypothetical protein